MPDNDEPNPYEEHELNIEEMFLGVPVSTTTFRNFDAVQAVQEEAGLEFLQRWTRTSLRAEMIAAIEDVEEISPGITMYRYGQITNHPNVGIEEKPKEPTMPERPYDIDFEHLKLLHDKLADKNKPTPDYFNLLRDFTNKEGIIPLDNGYNRLTEPRLDFEDYVYRAHLNVNHILSEKDYSMFATSENFKEYLHEIFRDHFNNGYLNLRSDAYNVHSMNRECLRLYFALLCPIPSSKDGWISYYTNGADFARGRRSRIKEGKFLRRVFPSMTDAEITAIVASYRERYVESQYELKVGTSREDFRKVYAFPLRRTNDLITTDERKSLANSCMNKFSGKASPVEAYASGDFEIWYMTDDVGLLAARTVVCPMHRTHGPLYVSSNGAYEQLKAKLEEAGYSLFDEGSWSGAKLLKICKYNNEYYMPYVDWHYWAYEDGEYFVISDSTECDEEPEKDKVISLSSASGSVIARNGSSSRYRCHCCGERYDEEEMTEGPDGYMYYEDHWNDLFFVSEYDDTAYAFEDEGRELVYVRSMWGEYWTSSQAEDYASYVTELSQYWHPDHVTSYLDNAGEPQHYPTYIIDCLDLFTDFITGEEVQHGENDIKVVDEFGDTHYTLEKSAMTKDKEYVWIDEENAFVHVTNFLEQEAA